MSREAIEGDQGGEKGKDGKMQSRLTNKFLIGLTASTLAWAAVPFSQAQLPEKCALTLSVTLPPTQLPEIAGEWNLALAPTGALCSTQEQKEKPQLSKNEHSQEALPACKVKQMAMRKRCHELDDREMDGTCGGLTGSFDLNGNGNMTMNDNSTQNITLSGQAQQNLNSLVNITSVNSTIS